MAFLSDFFTTPSRTVGPLTPINTTCINPLVLPSQNRVRTGPWKHSPCSPRRVAVPPPSLRPRGPAEPRGAPRTDRLHGSPGPQQQAGRWANHPSEPGPGPGWEDGDPVLSYTDCWSIQAAVRSGWWRRCVRKKRRRRRRQQACEATPAGGANKCSCSSTASLMLTGLMKPAETPEPLERHDEGDRFTLNLTI